MGSTIADRIARLSMEERLQLENRLAAGARPPADPIPRRPDPGAPAPLSFAQQGLWLTYQIDGCSWPYNIGSSIRLRGPLGVDALERALGDIAHRHEILRTTIGVRDGEPVQTVSAATSPGIELIDLSRAGEAEQRSAVDRIVAEETYRSFDHDGGPLQHVRVVQLGPEEHVLFLSMDHLVADGWSAGVWVRELGSLYRAHLQGSAPALPDLPIQYADFAEWQRRTLVGAVRDGHLKYWTDRLAGAPSLQWTRRRSAEPGFGGERVAFTVPRDVADGLKRLARHEAAGVLTTLLTAFYVVLVRATGQRDLSVGTPIANRTSPETEGLIGLFANMLVLRADLSSAATLRAVLRHVREVVLGAYEHRELPLEAMVEALQPPRSPGRPPLFDVAFALQQRPRDGIDLAQLRAEPLGIERTFAKYDFAMALEERADGFRGFAVYRTAVLDRELVQALVADYQIVARALAADPDLPIESLPLRCADWTAVPLAAVEAPAVVGALTRECTPPRTAIETDLHSIWEDLLPARPIGVTDSFFDLGGHSLLAVRLLSRIRERHGRQLSMAAFFSEPTIEHLARLLSVAVSEFRPLVVLREGAGLPPLTCVHPSSGSVACFVELARSLSQQRPVYALRAPHPAEDPEPAKPIEQLAREYLAELRTRVPHGPYLFAGYSSGCTIAFEMAQQVRAGGGRVDLLALFDGVSPILVRSLKDRSDAFNLAGIIRDLARVAGADITLRHEDLRALSPEDGVRHVLAVARDAGLLSPDRDLEWVRRLLAGLRGRVAALRDYQPAPFDGVITLFRSSEVEPESAKAWADMGVPVMTATRGWEALSTQPLRIIQVPGHHATIFAQPHVTTLIARLDACLPSPAD